MRTEAVGTAKKSSATEIDRPAKFPQKPEPAAPDSGGEAAEKEWFRKHTSTTIDTGLRKITKNADGSFDYD